MMRPRVVAVMFGVAVLVAAATYETARAQNAPVAGLDGLSADERAMVERHAARWHEASAGELRDEHPLLHPQQRAGRRIHGYGFCREHAF